MTEAVTFVVKHRNRGALFDANLLLVYVVGKLDKRRLSDFGHTEQYKEEFPLIEKLVESFSILHTTPNVLTEVSNLGSKLGPSFFDLLQRVVTKLDEQYCASKDAVGDPHFRKLGLTDAALIVGAKSLVVTLDAALHSILRARKIDAVNYHHFREDYWSGRIRL
ncbi:MAG TPA: hypothetical protein VEX68_15530 [Bryobacteraceae bacterium]|nr:hypothetical protein [Bryobacteraceae bacterium]